MKRAICKGPTGAVTFGRETQSAPSNSSVKELEEPHSSVSFRSPHKCTPFAECKKARLPIVAVHLGQASGVQYGVKE